MWTIKLIFILKTIEFILHLTKYSLYLCKYWFCIKVWIQWWLSVQIFLSQRKAMLSSLTFHLWLFHQNYKGNYFFPKIVKRCLNCLKTLFYPFLSYIYIIVCNFFFFFCDFQHFSRIIFIYLMKPYFLAVFAILLCNWFTLHVYCKTHNWQEIDSQADWCYR